MKVCTDARDVAMLHDFSRDVVISTAKTRNFISSFLKTTLNLVSYHIASPIVIPLYAGMTDDVHRWLYMQ